MRYHWDAKPKQVKGLYSEIYFFMDMCSNRDSIFYFRESLAFAL